MHVLFAVTRFLTKPEPDNTPKLLYAACAFCYMGAMVASNQALIYINYPTQVNRLPELSPLKTFVTELSSRGTFVRWNFRLTIL